MLLRPELSKNALTSGIFKSSLIATNIATDYYEYIIKLTFSVYLIDIKSYRTHYDSYIIL
jgi:hypothetical protein